MADPSGRFNFVYALPTTASWSPPSIQIVFVCKCTRSHRRGVFALPDNCTRPHGRLDRCSLPNIFSTTYSSLEPHIHSTGITTTKEFLSQLTTWTLFPGNYAKQCFLPDLPTRLLPPRNLWNEALCSYRLMKYFPENRNSPRVLLSLYTDTILDYIGPSRNRSPTS